MAGTHRKGTNDADGDGKKGGSLPEKVEARLALLEERVATLEAVARLNGWSGV